MPLTMYVMGPFSLGCIQLVF